MNGTNRKLFVAALVLMALSAMTYRNALSRADRFERGQKLLPNLDTDTIAAIDIRSGGRTVSLRREGDGFVLAEANGYRARNDEINRLVRDLQGIKLVKRVGEGGGLARDLGFESVDGDVEATGANVEVAPKAALEVTLEDAAGGELVRFQVGAVADSGGGNFVRRLDGDDGAIYLTEEPLRVADTPDRFLETRILNVARAEIVRVQGADFTLSRAEEGDDLELEEIPRGRRASSTDVDRIANLLSGLKFEDVRVADHTDVRDLRFEDVLRYELEDGSGYVLQTATADERTFLRVSGFHSVERVEIAMDTTDAEMREKSEILHRADEIQRFNALHGSWVYGIDAATADTLAISVRDLLEADR